MTATRTRGHRVPTNPVVDGRYELLALLAHDTACETWRARDVQLRREVSVQLFHTHDETARLDGRAAFADPALATVFDGGVWSDRDGSHRAYLVTELVSGTTLQRVLAEGPVGPQFAASVAVCVAGALARLHRGGATHGSVTPAHIVVLPPGWPVAAKLVEPRLPADVGSAADIGAFGSVLQCLFPTVIGGRADGWQALVGDMRDADPHRRPSAVEVSARIECLLTPASAPTLQPVDLHSWGRSAFDTEWTARPTLYGHPPAASGPRGGVEPRDATT